MRSSHVFCSLLWVASVLSITIASQNSTEPTLSTSSRPFYVLPATVTVTVYVTREGTSCSPCPSPTSASCTAGSRRTYGLDKTSTPVFTSATSTLGSNYLSVSSLLRQSSSPAVMPAGHKTTQGSGYIPVQCGNTAPACGTSVAVGSYESRRCSQLPQGQSTPTWCRQPSRASDTATLPAVRPSISGCETAPAVRGCGKSQVNLPQTASKSASSGLLSASYGSTATGKPKACNLCVTSDVEKSATGWNYPNPNTAYPSGYHSSKQPQPSTKLSNTPTLLTMTTSLLATSPRPICSRQGQFKCGPFSQSFTSQRVQASSVLTSSGKSSSKSTLSRDFSRTIPSFSPSVPSKTFSKAESTPQPTSDCPSQSNCPPLKQQLPAISCPGHDNTVWRTTAGTEYVIECFIDRHESLLAVVEKHTLQECIMTCEETKGCMHASWGSTFPGTPCMLKGAVGEAQSNKSIWGARVISAPKSET